MMTKKSFNDKNRIDKNSEHLFEKYTDDATPQRFRICIKKKTN